MAPLHEIVKGNTEEKSTGGGIQSNKSPVLRLLQNRKNSNYEHYNTCHSHNHCQNQIAITFVNRQFISPVLPFVLYDISIANE
jgi:hypothetical protein